MEDTKNNKQSGSTEPVDRKNPDAVVEDYIQKMRANRNAKKK